MLLTMWINRQGQSEIPPPLFIEEVFFLKGSEEIGEWLYFMIRSARWLILQGFSDLFKRFGLIVTKFQDKGIGVVKAFTGRSVPSAIIHREIAQGLRKKEKRTV